MVYARTSEIDLCLVRDLEKRKHRGDIKPNLDVQFMADALTKRFAATRPRLKNLVPYGFTDHKIPTLWVG